MSQAEREARSGVLSYITVKSEYERAAGRGDAFEKLISTKLYARFTRSLHRVVGLLKKLLTIGFGSFE